jgi:toxin ParE1/3/4
MGYRLSPQARLDLRQIWDHIARESGRVETATRQIEAITLRFPFLSANPLAGRARDYDLGRGRRSFPVRPYVIVYRVLGRDVLILRVAHGRRDLEALMR